MAKFTQDRMFEMLGDISKTKKPVYKQGGYSYDGGGEVVIDGVTYILYGPNWINKNTGAVVKDEYLKYRLYNAKPNESVAQNPIKPVTIVNKTRSEKIQELKNSPLLDNQKEVEILREAQRKEDLYNPQINLEDHKRPKDGSNFVGAEYDLNKSLGFPMDKAVIAADAANQNSVVPDGVVANDQADNFRHPNAARYTAEAIANNTGNIPYLSNALGFLGANALGIGHEVSSHLITQFNPKLDTRPFMTRLQESGEDIYNNYVGAKTGASNMTPEEKTNYLLYLSNTNQLPDGTVSSLPFKKGFSNNMYFKKDENDKGQYKSSYADGGTIYNVKGSKGNYKKINGQWQVDWDKSGKYQPLSKGDVKARTAILDKMAKPVDDGMSKISSNSSDNTKLNLYQKEIPWEFSTKYKGDILAQNKKNKEDAINYRAKNTISNQDFDKDNYISTEFPKNATASDYGQRIWEYATNPGTALEYAFGKKSGQGPMPFNINQLKEQGVNVNSNSNLVGNMFNMINPLDDVELIRSGVSDIYEGNNSGYLNAGLGLLGFLPGGDALKGSKNLIKKNIKTNYDFSPENLKEIAGFLPRRQFIKKLQEEELIGKNFQDLNYAARSTDKTNNLTQLALNREATKFRGVQGKVPIDGKGTQKYTGRNFDMSKPSWSNEISEFENMKNAGVNFDDPVSIAKYQATHIPMEKYGYTAGMGDFSHAAALYASDRPSGYGKYMFKMHSPRDYSIGNYQDWFNKYHNLESRKWDKLAVKDGYWDSQFMPNNPYDLPILLDRNTVVGKKGQKMFDIDETYPFTDYKNLGNKQIEYEEFLKKLGKDFDTGFRGQYQYGGENENPPDKVQDLNEVTVYGNQEKINNFQNSGGLQKFVGGGALGCPMFYKRDPISGECIPFTETEKSEYGTQYMKDWVQSPMHNEMLKASVAKDITTGDNDRVLNDEEKVLLDKYVNKYSKNITDLRLKVTNPKVSILESDNDNLPLGEAYPYQLKDSIYFDDPSTLKLMNYQFADYDNPKNIDKNLQAEVNYYTKNYPGEHAYVYPHEVSHLQDMGGSLIPQSDITMMEDYAFSPEIQAVYQNMLKEIKDISSKEPFDEQAKKLYLDEQDIIYKKYYPQFHKRYNQDKELYEKDFNKYKVQNVPKELTDIWKTLDNTLPYDEFIKKYKRFGDPVNKHKYISNVSETRARLNAIRMYGQASGIYNPFEEKLSPEKYKELQNLFYQQNPNDIDANQLRQLREVYTDEEIFNLLNSISKNEPQQIDELKTPQARQGGALDKFVGGGPTDCKQGEYWNGTRCVPTYGINPSFSNNALTNNVNGINTKIAETQRKGMAYQSTADELNALNTQKEILRADEAKRKALETQERQRQQQLRTVGSDNTRVDNSITKNYNANFQLPYERAETITKAQKDAARQIVTNGDFGNYFPEQMDYYLSKENSHRQGGPLTLEELALQQIRTNPDFFQSLEEKKYQDFQKREQKTYDNMPWYMKGINTVNALASDPLTTLERGLLEWERPLAFQGLQSTDPSIVGDDARFYDRALNRDENFLNNTLNYINPFRAASSAGQNLQQGDYGDAVVDFATIIPMLKGAKAGWKGLNAAMRVSPATLLKGAGSNILANASPLVQATANKATVGNLLTLYGGYEAGAHNFPNAYDAYSKGDWKTGNKELFMGVAMGTPLALEMGVGYDIARGAKNLGKFFGTDSKAAFVTDDFVLDLESQIAKLKEQQVLTEESAQILMSDYKAGKISAEEYTSLYKELDPNKLLNSKVELETILKEYKVKQDIANTPQQNILKSEEQLGKNISDGGISNKGVFEVGDKYVARLSAHGYDDASRLVKYADKIKSPRIAKTLQVKELNGKVYQVQEKVIGTPVEILTETELQNIPKKHIDNFLKDKAELEKLGLYIDFDNANSNMLYNSKKGFQFIDLGISPVGNNMMASNEAFAQTYKGLKLPGSPSSFSSTSINAANTGAPLNRFIEKKYLSKEEAEALKLANPQMKTKLIKEAKINGTLLPERFPMTIEGQQQAFDDATDFGLNWGLKDADAYNTIQSDFLAKSQRHSDLLNELIQYGSSTRFQEIDQKVSKIYTNILEEYFLTENITVDDYLRSGDPQHYQEFFANKRAEIIAENSQKSIDLQRGESYRNKIGKLESEKQQLAHDLQLLQDSKQSQIDPAFKEKVQNLYREAGVPEMQIPKNAFYDRQGIPITNFGKNRVKLIEMNQLNPSSEPSFAALSDADQTYLANNWKKLKGVRTDDATMTFQSKIYDEYYTERTAPKTTVTHRYEPAKEWHPLKPWTWKNYNSVGKHVREVNREPYIDEPILIEELTKIRENPTELSGVNVHEIGHDYQEFFQDWGKLLTEYDPQKGYYTGHSKNKLAKRFQDAMIKGKNITKEQLKKGDYEYDTWLSSPNELHSELMKARYKIYNNAKAEQPEMSQRDIINWIKEGEARGDDNIFDYYIRELNSHFKPETTNAERKALIKMLPVLIPAVGFGVIKGMDNKTPQNKYGGNVKTLSKFIKK